MTVYVKRAIPQASRRAVALRSGATPGGSGDADNLVLACRSCNRKKAARVSD